MTQTFGSVDYLILCLAIKSNVLGSSVNYCCTTNGSFSFVHDLAHFDVQY